MDYRIDMVNVGEFPQKPRGIGNIRRDPAKRRMGDVRRRYARPLSSSNRRGTLKTAFLTAAGCPAAHSA